MPRETPSPIDLPDPRPERLGLGWTSGVIATATLFLLIANAVSLSGWIDEQPPGPLQAWVAQIADEWVTITERSGLGVPRSSLHRQWKRIESARFATAAARGGER